MKIAQYVLVLFATAFLSAICLKLTPLPFLWVFLLWTVAFAAIAAITQRRFLRIAAVNLCLISFVFMLFETLLLVFPDLGRNALRPEVQHEGTYTSGYFRDDVPYLGYGPEPGMMSTSLKFAGKTMLYDVQYSIGANGLRVTPPPRNQDEGAILFFGGSHTFGEGVNDQESMPYRVAERSNGRYHVFNFGFHGYGPHQMLSSLEHRIVDRVLRGVIPIVIIYQALPGHARRSAGRSKWDKHGPRYTLTETGEVIFSGTFNKFTEELSPYRIWFYWQVKKSSIGRRLLAWERKTNREDVDLMVGIVAKTQDYITHNWPDAEFHVLLWNNDSWISHALEDGFRHRGVSVHRLSSVFPGLRRLEYRIPIDNHPNARAHDMIATYVVKEMLEKRLDRTRQIHRPR
jgi:hypothetical protein